MMSSYSQSMDPPLDDIDLKPEIIEEETECGPLFHCELYDTDIVHKISQSFLPGLASACIDNTTGGLLKSPASVAVDIRREMVDYLIQRTENFVAEAVVLEADPDINVSENPFDIISDFVDDFVSSKRNFFSRVSGWLLSDKREDWIDDLVQEMEINGFWLLNRRNAVAQTLLKNVDFKNTYHCNMSFKTPEDLEEHKLHCNFRTVDCSNEGCNSTFSAAQMAHHDSICPFKIFPCEQNCSDSIMRRDMDRHCITVCPMKLVKCPFHSVGCQSNIPQCKIEQHRSENLRSHLLYVLQVFHKNASIEDVKERAEEVEKLSSPGRLASARDARSLTMAIKNIDAKLGPLKAKILIEDKKATEVTNEVRCESPSKEKESIHVGSQGHGKEGLLESPANLTVMESVLPTDGNRSSPTKDEVKMGKSSTGEVIEKHLQQEGNGTSVAEDELLHAEATTKKEVSATPPGKENIPASPLSPDTKHVNSEESKVEGVKISVISAGSHLQN